MQKIISRDEYLLSRAIWKAEYIALAAKIRALKIATRLASKAGYSAQARVNEAKQAVASVLQSMRARESNFAHYMMDELEELKETARISVQFTRYLDLCKAIETANTLTQPCPGNSEEV